MDLLSKDVISIIYNYLYTICMQDLVLKTKGRKRIIEEYYTSINSYNWDYNATIQPVWCGGGSPQVIRQCKNCNKVNLIPGCSTCRRVCKGCHEVMLSDYLRRICEGCTFFQMYSNNK